MQMLTPTLLKRKLHQVKVMTTVTSMMSPLVPMLKLWLGFEAS